MNKIVVFFGLAFFGFLASRGSVPEIINFSAKDYSGHAINYRFVQDTSGVMYVGNAYGILEYDGRFWRTIPINDGKSALSMDVSDKGVVFIGSSDEFGYLKRDAKGKNQYISLKSKLPKIQMGEILNTVCYKDAVYFHSMYNLFCYKNDSVYTITPKIPGHIVYYLDTWQNSIVSFQLGVGQLQVNKVSYQVVSRKHKSETIFGILNLERDTIFVASNKILSSNETNDFALINSVIGETGISAFLKISENEFLIGTVGKGIFHLNKRGQILSNLTTTHGLQDNFIRSLYLDRTGNVWAAYNNGIGIIKWNSPIRYIDSSIGIEGMGYCGVVKGDTLYVGTSRGVYYLPSWKNGLNKLQLFKKVKGIKNTINDLKIQNGVLIAAQEAEVYEIYGDQAKMISDGSWIGAWFWNPSKINQNEAFVGNYEGLTRYVFAKGHWNRKAYVKNFNESSRMFEVDKRGVIWVVQGNKGLYRVQLNSQRDAAVSVKNYSEIYHFPPQYFNDIFSLGDSILVSSFGGVFYIKGDSLEHLPAFSALGKKSYRIRKFHSRGLYSIDEDRPHELEFRGKRWEIKNSPVSFLKSYLVGSAEFFYELESNYYLIGTQEGFATFQPKPVKKPVQTQCLIREFALLDAPGDSVLYFNKPSETPVIPYSRNNIRITFSIPLYGEGTQLQYETRLYKSGKPLHDWQRVNQVNFKEYTNLKEGKYTFWVRAKKGDELVGHTSVNFIVSPPWYRTIFAYFFYFILLIIGAYYVYRLFLNQEKKLEAEKQKELEVKEKLHRAEKLEIELKNKDNELAYMALSYTQKKELLETVMGKLDSFSKDLNHEEQIKLRGVKSAITSNLDDESNWQNFEVHFDQNNNNFFQKLKEKESSLNESYLLFCSYVRMGKSNKEIAELLNISVAAVEKRKYRLKKKWNLADDTSFTEFLRNL